jgi:hypothetical protein
VINVNFLTLQIIEKFPINIKSNYIKTLLSNLFFCILSDTFAYCTKKERRKDTVNGIVRAFLGQTPPSRVQVKKYECVNMISALGD